MPKKFLGGDDVRERGKVSTPIGGGGSLVRKGNFGLVCKVGSDPNPERGKPPRGTKTPESSLNGRGKLWEN